MERPLLRAKGNDTLWSLPAHLLDEVLKRLQVRDAVRTSVLSRAWRRRWESVNGLDASFPDGTPPSVIARVLRRYPGPDISCFSVCIDNNHDNIDDCLIALSHRSVESISISKRFEPRLLALHSSIFSFHRLVSLHLENCSIPPRPQSGFADFPVLQELSLIDTDLADNGERDLQAIIQGSPLLRTLELANVFTPVDCMIEAPNLQTLLFDMEDDDHWRIGRLQRLQSAKICVLEYLPHGHDGHRLLEFFASVSHVRDLLFHSPVNQNRIKIDRIPFTFYNLKSLEIKTHFLNMESILLFFSLLRSSPYLEKLKIEIESWAPERITNWDILSEEWTNEQWTDGMFANLQVVEINCYIRWLPLSFLKLILSKASLLRTLSVDVCLVSQDDPLNELLTCRRASAQAQVLFKEDLDSGRDGELSE